MDDPRLEQIILHHGFTHQTLKAVEELTECAAALARHISSDGDFWAQAVCEVADATIMLAQMRLILGEKNVDREIELKLSRTIERMGKNG